MITIIIKFILILGSVIYSTAPYAKVTEEKSSQEQHQELYLKDIYPSASQCASCHPRQYKEWSVSQHAYAQLSPVYMAMQTAVNLLTSGTNGDFCLRCHTPVGTQIKEPLALANLDRNPASREGITCITCHRVAEKYGKISGRLSLQEGSIVAAVKGPTGSDELKRVLSEKKKFRNLSTDNKNNRGKKIHAEIEPFFSLSDSDFCGTCHDVNLVNNFRLEEALSDYRTSPASKNGTSCQDCHMGKTQGLDSNYHELPAAKIGKALTKPRRATNHYFAGPDHSIIHPGIFPHPLKPPRNLVSKTLRDWLKFDMAAGWGDKKQEEKLGLNFVYPKVWKTKSHRKAARNLLLEQCELLDWAQQQRIEVLSNALVFGQASAKIQRRKIKLSLPVLNQTNGHNVPTGFDAERLVFIEITVLDEKEQVLFKSGMRDPNGDLLDLHSQYVEAGQLPLDKQLFNLQSKFLTRLARGGEREQVLAINTSLSAQPFIRPETRPSVIYGRPLGARKHRQVIPAKGARVANYTFKNNSNLKWPLLVNAKLIWQMVPVNLVHAISVAGFDYELSEKQVAERVVAGAVTIDSLHFSISKTGKIKLHSDTEGGFSACNKKDFVKSQCQFSTPLCKNMSSKP